MRAIPVVFVIDFTTERRQSYTSLATQHCWQSRCSASWVHETLMRREPMSRGRPPARPFVIVTEWPLAEPRVSTSCRCEPRSSPTAAWPGYSQDPCFRSEEHTSELQSLMHISYAVFSLKKTIRINIRIKTRTKQHTDRTQAIM